MSGVANEGTTQAGRSLPLSSNYLPNSEFNSNSGGKTYTSHQTEPTIADYENVFGPSARDIKDDLQRYKRHGRWHLPDILKGPNPWLADRVDGLITDATNSPFTTTILPYKYFENVDGKLKWNVWSFDEAMPSRVPYESAARTLTQTKRSFSGYAVRHGLAITLEHNFMMTPQGRENFQNQLNQLVGSIQYANDLDVHMALILAPSYEKHMLEKYNNYDRSATQTAREFVDLFGFMQKNQNALDILIEEAKIKLKTWGGPQPNFMLTNSKLTFQLTMTPERTNYITQGIDGVKRLRNGPDLQSYRGLNIIPSRSFSMETGQTPRDMLRRRVRVAEYYRITPDPDNRNRSFELYNEERDTFFTITWRDLIKFARFPVDPNDPQEVQGLMVALNAQLTERAADEAAGIPPINKKLQAPEIPSMAKWKSFLSAAVPTEQTANIPLDQFLATVADDKVFVPFTCNWVETKETSNPYAEPWEKKIDESLANYPRIPVKNPVKFAKELRSVFTMQETTRDTLEYNETRVMMVRMHNRYAVPTSVIHITKDNQIQVNTKNVNKEDLPAQDFFMQPLGAFREPNHPLYAENMPLGKARDVHMGWILTENVLDLLLANPGKIEEAAKIACSINGTGMTKAAYSIAIAKEIESEFASLGLQKSPAISAKQLGMYTWTVEDNYLCSNDYLSPSSTLGASFHQHLRAHAPNAIVTSEYLEKLIEMGGNHPWLAQVTANGTSSGKLVEQVLAKRLNEDVYSPYITSLQESVGFDRLKDQIYHMNKQESTYHTGHFLGKVVVVDNVQYDDRNANDRPIITRKVNSMIEATKLEFVIIRPNIEHYMLGVILGLSGEQLGNTLWGQTELSVYDDAQHGVWGMSYKYHERAIVFNEKNLIRLWDIAYDGYNGGKDDTHVNWTSPNDVEKFKEDTNDVTRDYHGKSMMVLAFYHGDQAAYNAHYKTNWPSPMNFYDREDGQVALPVGPENQANTQKAEFRVFNNDLYHTQYRKYFTMMPNFYELHQMRKSASEAVKDNETQVDCLAFQGTMRIKKNGAIIDQVNGSGHHGPDYVGAGSVRAGKGYKMVGGITQVVRQI